MDLLIPSSFCLHEHLLHHRQLPSMTENHIVKENDAIKKIALPAAEVRSKGAEGADRRFARWLLLGHVH